jgi:5'(3')-deoxyribonucleotidase
MNIRRTIYDCDGVLADWTSYLLNKLNCGLTIDDCFEFRIRNVLKKLRGRDVAKHADVLCSQPSFTANQPVFPWAQELVDIAHTAGDLLVVTSPWRAQGWYDARIDWLKQNLGVQQDEVMVGRAKFWVKADLFVDDKPSNIIEWAVDNPGGRAVLLAWPYNKDHVELPTNARRLQPLELLSQLHAGFPEWK